VVVERYLLLWSHIIIVILSSWLGIIIIHYRQTIIRQFSLNSFLSLRLMAWKSWISILIRFWREPAVWLLTCSKNVISLQTFLFSIIWDSTAHWSFILLILLLVLAKSIVGWTLNLLVLLGILLSWHLKVFLPVCVENYEVVILGNVFLQTIMLPQKSQQFLTGSIICQFVRSDSLMLQHFFKNSFTMTSSLHWLMNIKV